MAGEVEEEGAYYSRDNFNVHSKDQLQRKKVDERNEMTHTIEVQSLELQRLNSEMDKLKGLL
jgi:hypothetical protein